MSAADQRPCRLVLHETVLGDSSRCRPAEVHPHRDRAAQRDQPADRLGPDRCRAGGVSPAAGAGPAVAATAVGDRERSRAGRHLAQWLLARGEEVLDVPPTATARARQLSRGGGRKNDQIDAAAAATSAATQGDACPVDAEDHTTALALLDERRVNLTQTRVRAVNQLHTLLRGLLPGGAPAQLSTRRRLCSAPCGSRAGRARPQATGQGPGSRHPPAG
ncbi:transposase [Actinomadura sp. 3N508]|uniref:IS110 family transposase n=1 Tax=Actinomadura sp. 3N508 TaxID=3375153 RepID=UPI00379E4A74